MLRCCSHPTFGPLLEQIIEMVRKLLFVGFFLVLPGLPRGSLRQAVLALLVSISYRFCLEQAAPYPTTVHTPPRSHCIQCSMPTDGVHCRYKNPSDGWVAKSGAFCTVILFGCCVFYKLESFTELAEVQALMSEQHRPTLALLHI